VAVVAVLVALIITGAVSVTLGGGRRRQAVTRLLAGGSLAMAVTYGVGQLVGVAV
jgi:VIT1/CCC1 family predicted Fe2+/Mn2+ transporter